MSGLSFHWIQYGESRGDTRPVLHVQGLSVKVGVREVLSNIDMEVYLGDHVRVSGPNGSGKSTLLNAIAGIEPAQIIAGHIVFNGLDITHLPAHIRAGEGIAYMRQTGSVFGSLSVKENLRLALGDDGPTKFKEEYPDWASSMPFEKSAGLLSGGQKKKLAWGMTMLKSHNALWMLDEPKAGVDGEDGLMSSMHRAHTVIFIEHEGESR